MLRNRESVAVRFLNFSATNKTQVAARWQRLLTDCEAGYSPLFCSPGKIVASAKLHRNRNEQRLLGKQAANRFKVDATWPNRGLLTSVD